MDFKKLGERAKALVDKRGGTESVKEDAEELRDIAKGQGSLSDKAKAATSAIKQPGSDPAAQAPASPAAEASEPALGRDEEQGEREGRGKRAGGQGRRHDGRGGGRDGV